MTRLISLFLLLAAPAFSQEFNFRHIGSSQGLASSECYYVLQDSKGYMWFSSNAGICRYNGRNFRYFNVSNGLPDNTVFELYEDRKERLWFHTISGVLGYIHKDSIHLVPVNNELKKLLFNGQLLIYGIDGDREGIVLSTADGYFKIREAGGFSSAERVNPVCDTCLHTVRETGTGVYLIASNRKGSAFFSKDKSKMHVSWNGRTYTCPLKNLSYTIPDVTALPLGNGQLVMGISNHLFVLDKGYVNDIPLPNRIIYLYRDPQDGIWVGLFREGLYYYGTKTVESKPLISLKGLSVSSVLSDREGGIWATTLEKGVYYSPTKNITDFLSVKGLDEKISSVSASREGLVAGNFQPSVFLIKGSNDPQVLPVFRNRFDSITNLSHLGFMDAGKEVILAGNPLQRGDSTLKIFKPIPLKGRGISTNIYNTTITGTGEIYGINHGCIYKIGPAYEEILTYLPARGRCIKAGSRDRLFVGTVNGVFLYKNGQFSSLNEPAVMRNTKISFIEEDAMGRIWIGTEGKGLAVLDKEQAKVIGEKEGLASGICNAIAFDTAGNAWVGTNKGISRIGAGNKISNFNSSHGLISNEVFKLAVYEGKLYAGTPLGLFTIDLSKELANLEPPRVYIKTVTMNDSVLGPGAGNSFNHNENSLHFIVEGLSYKAGEGPGYSYRLLPIDTVWTFSLVNEISYTTLPPGNYTLEVKAVNNSGVESAVPALYSFSIQKPFWREWWFLLLSALLAALLVYAFIVSRLRIIRRKEEDKTRINTMIAEYQMTAIRAQMNPHFIFNAINSIQNFILDKNTQEAYDYLAKFSRLIRLVLNNAQEQTLSIEKELEMLGLYVELEQLRFRNSFDFRLEVENESDLASYRIPAMLIQPFVENAIWHGIMPLEGRRIGKLSLSMIKENSMLRIIIEDNGIGREQSRKIKKSPEHKSLGMMLTGKRLEVLNNLPETERSSIRITDLVNDKKEGIGTRVEIVVPLFD